MHFSYWNVYIVVIDDFTHYFIESYIQFLGTINNVVLEYKRSRSNLVIFERLFSIDLCFLTKLINAFVKLVPDYAKRFIQCFEQGRTNAETYCALFFYIVILSIIFKSIIWLCSLYLFTYFYHKLFVSKFFFIFLFVRATTSVRNFYDWLVYFYGLKHILSRICAFITRSSRLPPTAGSTSSRFANK